MQHFKNLLKLISNEVDREIKSDDSKFLIHKKIAELMLLLSKCTSLEGKK